MKSPDDDIAVYMIAALGEKLKARAAVPTLMEIADREQWPGRYHSAARALIEIGDPRAIPVIRKLVENEPDHEYLPPGAMRKYFQTGLQKLETLKTQ